MLAPSRGGSQQRFVERAQAFATPFEVEVLTDLQCDAVASALAAATARPEFDADLHCPVMTVLRRPR